MNPPDDSTLRELFRTLAEHLGQAWHGQHPGVNETISTAKRGVFEYRQALQAVPSDVREIPITLSREQIATLMAAMEFLIAAYPNQVDQTVRDSEALDSWWRIWGKADHIMLNGSASFNTRASTALEHLGLVWPQGNRRRRHDYEALLLLYEDYASKWGKRRAREKIERETNIKLTSIRKGVKRTPQ